MGSNLTLISWYIHEFIQVHSLINRDTFRNLSHSLIYSLLLHIYQFIYQYTYLSIFLPFFLFPFFSRGHATLHLAVSVGRSVRYKLFWILSGFCITAPAQPSATVLPCIRPCFFSYNYFILVADSQLEKCFVRPSVYLWCWNKGQVICPFPLVCDDIVASWSLRLSSSSFAPFLCPF